MTLDRESIHHENLKSIQRHRLAMDWLLKDFRSRGWNLESLMDAVKGDGVLALSPREPGADFPKKVHELHLLTRTLPGVLFTGESTIPAEAFATHRLALHQVPGASLSIDGETPALVLWDGRKPVAIPLGFKSVGDILPSCLDTLALPTEGRGPEAVPHCPWPRRALLTGGESAPPQALCSLDAFTQARITEHVFRLFFPGETPFMADGEPGAGALASLQVPKALLAAEFRLRSGGALDPLAVWRALETS